MNIGHIEQITKSGPEVIYDADAATRTNPVTPSANTRPFSNIQSHPQEHPAFPKAAWRGPFAAYRDAMARATEASEVFHFATLWARGAVALGRTVHFPYGSMIYPNVFLVGFGPTGDRKTTAMRNTENIGARLKMISGGGSGEGIADNFASAEPGQGLLIYAEEFSQVLRPGRWEGATLIPFLTQCFDCPERYEMKYRKNPIDLERPTPSLLAGTTPDWFWQDFRLRDFQGGFGNRLFFLTGQRKEPIPLPDIPVLSNASQAIDSLSRIAPCQAELAPDACALWEQFYRAWDADEATRDPLLLAAAKRIPAYVLKLAMLYAAFEATLPKIALDQLKAAIQVGRFGEACVRELLALQNAGTNPKKELERRILAFVGAQPRGVTTKREIYKRLWRHYSDTEAFNRVFESLARAGELFPKSGVRGTVLVSLEPMD
jgi:hypothetical protein